MSFFRAASSSIIRVPVAASRNGSYTSFGDRCARSVYRVQPPTFAWAIVSSLATFFVSAAAKRGSDASSTEILAGARGVVTLLRPHRERRRHARCSLFSLPRILSFVRETIFGYLRYGGREGR